MSIYNSVFRQPMSISIDRQQESIRQTLSRYYAGSGIDEEAVLTSPVASMAQWLVFAYANGLIIDDNFVLNEISNEGYKIFDRMTDRDPHLFSVFDRMRTDASNIPFYLQPGIVNDPDSQRIFSFVEECLANMDISTIFHEMLRCVGFGFGVYDCVYKKFSYKSRSRLLLDSIEHVDEDYVRSGINRVFKFVPFGISLNHGSEFLPRQKYIQCRFRGGPYGDGLLKHAYPAYWFKRNGQIFAAQYLERWGSPPLIGYHNNEEQKNEVMDMLLNIRSSNVASLPTTTKELDILEPARQTDFMPLLNFWNDEMSKIFMFGTRTMSGSNGAGAYSATQAHADEADDRSADAGRFCIKILNSQIIPNLVRLNFGVQDIYPYATYGDRETEDPNDYVTKVNLLSNSKGKFSISMTEFYEKSGFSRPDPQIEGDELIVGDVVAAPVNFQEGELSLPSQTFPRTSSTGSNRQSNNLTRKYKGKSIGLQRYMQKMQKS